MESFEGYMQQPEALDFAEACEIAEKIRTGLRPDDEDDAELAADCLKAAAEYAYVRASWLLKSLPEKIEADPGRTAAHNLFIISLNTLARWYEKTGRDAAWRDELGDTSWREPGYDIAHEAHRKRIGDFACYLALIQGLNAR